MKESNFQFNKPVLKNIEYRINEEFDPEKEVKIPRNFQRNIMRAEGKNEAVVELTISLGNDEKSENPPFHLCLTIGAGFKWDNTLDEDTIGKLLSMNAPSLLLSYARPIISNITSNSIGEYSIPFMNFYGSDRE